MCCASHFAGDAPAAGATCEVASSSFIPLIEGAVAEYIAKWQERSAPRGTAQQVRCCAAATGRLLLLRRTRPAAASHVHVLQLFPTDGLQHRQNISFQAPLSMAGVRDLLITP